MDHVLQIKELLHTVAEANVFVKEKNKQGRLDQALFIVDDVLKATETVFRALSALGLKREYLDAVASQAEELVNNQKGAGFSDALDTFVERAAEVISSAQAAPAANAGQIANRIDLLFYQMMVYFDQAPLENIVSQMKENLAAIKKQNKERYQSILWCYNTYSYWGKIDPDNNIYELLHNRASVLKEHGGDFIWLYKRLCDYRSKKCFFGVIDNWITFNYNHLEECKENVYKHYFDLDIMQCSENEVFVDLGAYTGDTVSDYIHTFLGYKRIYCYEIMPETMQKLKENLSTLSNIEYRQKGASDKAGVMFISGTEPDVSMHKLTDSGNIEVQTVAIDEDIAEPVTFIKMDIEGAEQGAIMGCKNHIRATHPKLAISVYHNNEDIWKCARLIDEIDPNYKFYFRYNGGNIYPSEYVLLAI